MLSWYEPNPGMSPSVFVTESDKYPYRGHSALTGKVQRKFQDTEYVLRSRLNFQRHLSVTLHMI